MQGTSTQITHNGDVPNPQARAAPSHVAPLSLRRCSGSVLQVGDLSLHLAGTRRHPPARGQAQSYRAAHGCIQVEGAASGLDIPAAPGEARGSCSGVPGGLCSLGTSSPWWSLSSPAPSPSPP